MDIRDPPSEGSSSSDALGSHHIKHYHSYHSYLCFAMSKPLSTHLKRTKYSADPVFGSQTITCYDNHVHLVSRIDGGALYPPTDEVSAIRCIEVLSLTSRLH